MADLAHSKPDWLTQIVARVLTFTSVTVNGMLFASAFWQTMNTPFSTPVLLFVLYTALAYVAILPIQVIIALVGSTIARYRIWLLRLVPFEVRWLNHGLAIRLVSPFATATLVMGSPPDGHNLAQRLYRLCLTQLFLYSVLGLAFLVVSLQGFIQALPPFVTLFFMLASIQFLICSLPLRSSGTPAAALMHSLADPSWAEVSAASNGLFMQDILVRPRDFDPSLIVKATAPVEPSVESMTGHLLAYYWALDRGYIERAKILIDLFLQHNTIYPSQVSMLEVAYFNARYRGNSPHLRSWLSKGIDALAYHDRKLQLFRKGENDALRWRAEAAILLAEGKHSEAIATARAGLQSLANLRENDLTKAFAPATEDLLKDIIVQAEQSNTSRFHFAASPNVG